MKALNLFKFIFRGSIYAGLIVFAAVSATLLHAKEDAIQCANLIYGGKHTSRCFSDEFLSEVQRKTAIATERRFKNVKMDSDELFHYPFSIITGENDFFLSAKERANLKKYLTHGGFLLASAGCSNKEWDQAFRRSIRTIFGQGRLKKIPMDHTIFRTVQAVKELPLHHLGEKAALEGLEHDGKIVLVYSPHGLNDTAHTEGCCCCGGNEIEGAIKVNVNIFVYALLH